MTMAVTNPTTGMIEKEYPEHTEADIDSKLAIAQSAHETLRRTSFDQRAAWMRATADLMESEVDSLAPMMVREMGKPIAQAQAE
ncbi:MAG: aldehyde dehydrogenase family protein, partial [Microbacteriaceae bacterium]|nr:aldehyde dehydrogenase family protein [Microbacteriaceae bacterium]